MLYVVNSHCCAAERFGLLSFGDRISKDSAFKEKTTASRGMYSTAENSGKSMNTHLFRTLILLEFTPCTCLVLGYAIEVKF